MPLKCVHSLDFDAEQVVREIWRSPWFKQQGYLVKQYFPLGLLEELGDKVREIEQEPDEKAALAIVNGPVYDTVKKFVQEDYKARCLEKKYADGAKKVSEFYSKYESLFESAIKKLVPGTNTNYTCHFSGFASGGYFNLEDNSVTIPPGIIPVLLHELTHLAIQPFIEKYGIAHWFKEFTVRLVMNTDEFGFYEKPGFRDGGYGDCEPHRKQVTQLFDTEFRKSPETYFQKLSSYIKENVEAKN